MPGGNQTSSQNTKINFESLARQIGLLRGDIENQKKQLSKMLSQMGSTITQPIPAVPFKIYERNVTNGVMVTVTGQCPTNSEEISITLLRKSRNQILLNKDGTPKETIDDARRRAQAEAQQTTFRLPIDENQAAAQIFTVEIGPLPPKNDTDDKYQLLRLRVFDNKGAFAKNPTKNPFGAGTQLAAPAAPMVALAGQGAGTLTNGPYKYVCTFVDNFNNETTPSPVSNTVTIVDATTNGKVNVTIPKGPANKTKGRKIYRTISGGADLKLIDTVLNNSDTVFLDNKPDNALGIAPPTDNGTMGFPFPALIVSVDDAMTTEDERYYFTIGNSISGLPTAPSLADIVCNKVNLETSAADASLTFRVGASGADVNISFGEAGIQRGIIVLKKVADPAIPANATMDTDAPIKIPFDITDPSTTEARVQYNLPLGIQFQWVRTVVFNASGREMATAANITFYAGGDPTLTKLLVNYMAQSGASSDGRIRVVVTQENPNSSTVTVFFKQPAASAMVCDPTLQAVIFRKIRYLRQRADGAYVHKDTYNAILDETLFTPGEHSVSVEIPHKPNRTDINFRVELISLSLPITKITADSNNNSSVLLAVPIDPIASDVSTAPDGDTEAADAYVDVKIWTGLEARQGMSSAKSYSDFGIEQVFFVIKRLKNSTDPKDIDDPDTKYSHYTVPVPAEDKDAFFTVVRLRGLRLARKYRIRRTGFIGGNSVVQSAGAAPYDFIAGAGTLDITKLTLYPPTIDPIDKNASEVTCQFDQPVAGDPVMLKTSMLLRHNPNKSEKVAFIGSGTNDLSTGGSYSTTVSHLYVVTVTGTGNPNTVTITRDGVVIQSNTQIPIGLQIFLSDGVFITFNSRTGHGLNAQWTFTAGFKAVKTEHLKGIAEYSDNTSGAPPLTDMNLKYRKFVQYEVNHKQATSGIQYAHRITAVGNASADSAIFNAGDTGSDKPGYTGQQVPSIPQDADVVINQPNGDPAMAGTLTVIRIHATESRMTPNLGGTGINGEINFQDINADTAQVTLALASDTAGNKIFVPATIEDPTQVFIDISIPGLTFAEKYLIKRFTVSKSGSPVSMPGNVMFRAGGDSDLAGVSVSIIAVAVQDVRHSIITVRVTQPVGRVVFFKNLQIYRNQNSAGFKEVANSRIILRDDAGLYVLGGTKDFDFVVPHKKNVNIVYRIILQGVKGSKDGSVNGTPIPASDQIIVDSASGNTGDEQSFSDPGAPFYSGGKTPRLKLRWRPAGIRLRFRPPKGNMNTHVSNYVAMKINIFNPAGSNEAIIFNPNDSAIFDRQIGLILLRQFDPNNPNDDMFIDLDKGSQQFFGFNRPDQDSPIDGSDNSGAGELDVNIVNSIRNAVNNGGYAEFFCQVIVQNRFVPAFGQINYLVIDSQTIRWDAGTRKFNGIATESSFG
jgi:hypothetical protein